MDVLLVEDEAEMRALLQAVLESRGHTVTAFADGKSGWECYQKQHFPLVILDWLLPEMDGLEVCRKIRNEKQRSNCLILVITVRTSPGDLKQVLDAGADDYLAKPVNPQLLDIRLEIAEQRVKNMLYRQQIEAAQIAAVSELRISHENLNEAQHLAQMGSWELNLLSGKLRWSDEVYNIFELDKNRFGGKYAAFLDAIHPDDVEMVNNAYIQSIENHTPYQIVHRLLMNDGRIKWVEERCTSNFDAEGNPVFSRGTVQDITQRKLIEDDLIVAKEQAEEASKSKSAFLARMSHELRTPLNSILGFTQLIEMNADNESLETHRPNLKTVLDSGWHLLTIIDDLLNLSMIESRQVLLNIENIDIRDLMHECFEFISPLANQRKIRIACADDNCNGVIVRADAFRLQQVAVNLLDNAVKYNREGGTITVSSLRTPGHIRIMISDTGIGIPAKEVAALFEPFSQLAHRPYNFKGAGIGLSIAKQLTELMGGTIGVESVNGQGSTFWIEFPSVDGDTPTGIFPWLPEQSTVTEYKATLLYIDDNPVHVSLVEEIVSRMDKLSLVTAHTSRLGLDLAKSLNPDLILLDICLSGMSGFDVFKLLQADESTRNIPVVAISATNNPFEIEKALRAGFRRYLTKPINVLEFRKAVEELLRDSLKI